MGARDQIGRYELVSQIAQGGMGRIFLGRTMGLGGFERHVVIKTLEPNGESEEEDVSQLAAMFLDEARVLGMLHHQHIAPVLEIDEDRGRMYMAMEYVHGKTAADVWNRTLELGAALPIDFCLTVVSAAAAGLHYAHTRLGADGKPLGIVHRDVSLTNLMIGFDGAVKLIDFGIAKASGRRVKTQTGFVKGKIGYMAPEQVRRLDVDARTDVFALGIVLYELSTMARAFREESDRMTLERVKVGAYRKPTELNPDYPKELEKIVTRALRVDPRERFPDAESMRAAIEALGHKYDLVLGDAAVSEIMHQLFEDRREPWQTDDARPPTNLPPSNPPAAPRTKPLRTATDNAEALGKEIDAWAETLDAATPPAEAMVPPDAFDDEQATAISTLDPKTAFAKAARSSTVPVDEAAIASEEARSTLPDGVSALKDEPNVRAAKISRLFTESSFNPTETPPKPLDVLPPGVDGVPAIRTRTDDTPPAIAPKIEKADIGPISSIADTTDGVTILPASAVTGIAKEREAAAKEEAKASSSRRILLVALALVVAGGIAIAAVLFLRQEEPSVVPPPDPPDAGQIIATVDAAAAPAIDAAEPVAIDAAPVAPVADAGKAAAIDAAAPAPVVDAAPGGRTITVKLTSNPAGATVTLDGLKRLGKTPFDGPVEIPPGSHSLKIRLMGFNTIEIKITADDKSIERDLAMIKIPVPKPDDEQLFPDKKDDKKKDEKKDEKKEDKKDMDAPFLKKDDKKDEKKPEKKEEKKEDKKKPPPDDDLE